MNAPVSDQQRNRNRGLLVLIVVIFLGSALVAGLLRFSGWRPSGMKNHGELLQPPADLRDASLLLEDGTAYTWAPLERDWRILVVAPAACGAPCDKLASDLDTVWRLFGHRADHVHTLWMGPVSDTVARNGSWRVLRDDPTVRAQLPRLDDPAGVPVYVVDPNGFVVLRYAPDFDPAHLREDVARLLKLK